MKRFLWMMMVLGLVGCVAAPEEQVSSVGQDLSAFDWSPDHDNDDAATVTEPVVAALGNTVFVVYAKRCITNLLDHRWEASCTNGYLRYFYSQNNSGWSDVFDIPHASTTARPTLTAFNGHFYLFYASGTAQYMARYDSGVGWTASTRLPFDSLGAVAAAPYNGTLYLVRSDPALNGQLYWRTMNTAESFSAEQAITRKTDGSGCGRQVFIPWPLSSSPISAPINGVKVTPASASQASAPINPADISIPLVYYEYATSTPALTSFGGCLYLVHRDGATNTLVSNTFDTSWGTQIAVPSGPGGAAQTAALQPAITTLGNALHLVYVSSTGTSSIDWSYLQGATWSAPVTVPNHQTIGTPSMAAFVDRIYMVHRATDTVDDLGVWYSTYLPTQP
jgi:hypothetical protein